MTLTCRLEMGNYLCVDRAQFVFARLVMDGGSRGAVVSDGGLMPETGAACGQCSGVSAALAAFSADGTKTC